MGIKVELCASTLAEVTLASELGCDSVELCTWLSIGGVTPSNGFVACAVTLPLRVRVLVRPVPGGSMYDQAVRKLVFSEYETLRIIPGLHGLVTGTLDKAGLPDTDLLRALKERSPEHELTFHRAMDQAVDPEKALGLCKEVGVTRILTSGGKPTALEGSEIIARLCNLGGSRIAVTAAAGINGDNVVELIDRTGVKEVHFSAQKWVSCNSRTPLGTADENGSSIEPDRSKIEGILNALVKAGLR